MKRSGKRRRLCVSARFLTANLFVEIVNDIKGNSAGLRRIPGTRIVNPASQQIVYTPPEGE